MKNGNAAMRQSGTMPYHSINTPRTTPDIEKSMRLTMTALVGMISRGKYTFEINPELPTRLLPASLNALAKNCHGSNAVNTITA